MGWIRTGSPAMSPEPAPAKAGGTGTLVGKLAERDMIPPIPVWGQTEVAADGNFTRAHFTYDSGRDLYICPNGKELKTSRTVHHGTTLKCIAKRGDRGHCLLKPHCTTGRERRVSRDVNQPAREYTQGLMDTDPYRRSTTDRNKIERLFGEGKRHLSTTRFRLRGPTGAKHEFLLTATVQNLKRLEKHVIRPPPGPIIG